VDPIGVIPVPEGSEFSTSLKIATIGVLRKMP
jgi:hypothetical protein